MRVPLAREGYPFIAILAIPAALAVAAAAHWDRTLLWILACALVLLALCVAAFFRDPNRNGPRAEHLVLAPADGKVVDIQHVDEPDFLNGPALRVSIFLSLLDVHVNRYPVSGEVALRTYNSGAFEPAWRGSASHSNERATTGIRSSHGPFLVRQIAGLAARRIVTYARPGDRVRQGERMGLIRFGSRVDVFMPADARPAVAPGERAVGGVTVLAELRAPGSRQEELR